MGVDSFSVDEAMGGSRNLGLSCVELVQLRGVAFRWKKWYLDADDVAAAATAAASPYIGPRRFPMAGVEDVMMSAILSKSDSFVNLFMDTNLAMWFGVFLLGWVRI